MSTRINRRQFITSAVAGIGAATLMCSGLAAVATRSPIDPSYEKYVGEQDPKNQKVLVAYASKAGSTMEIAQAIAMELTKRGFAVDIGPAKRITDVNGYSHVVIGSAIRMSAPLPEATTFVEQHSTTLRSIPTAFFAVYLSNTGDDETSRKARLAYLDPIRNLVPLEDEAFFTGVYNPARMSLIEGLMGKMMNSSVGDFRDWKAISSWGQSIFNA